MIMAASSLSYRSSWSMSRNLNSFFLSLARAVLSSSISSSRAAMLGVYLSYKPTFLVLNYCFGTAGLRWNPLVVFSFSSFGSLRLAAFLLTLMARGDRLASLESISLIDVLCLRF
jgi:hypothetical protein